MQIELTEAEHQELIFLVEERLRLIRTEITQTATHEFKTVLNDREHLLEKINEKLKAKQLVY